MNIAFFGLGNMGGPMAHNLLKAGHSLTVFDLQEPLMAPLAEAGARAAESAQQAVQGAEVVISMLPSARAVIGLYLGDRGILADIDQQALIIDCSTIDAASAREVAEQAHSSGRAMIDAPVSGGVAGAAAATLTFICGGSEVDVVRAEPVLLQMGRKVFRAGDHGAGQTAKLCNNMLLAIQMIGTCEALQLGVDNGLDAAVLSSIMQASSGRNWSLELYNPWPGVMEGVPASRDYQGGFTTELMNKDLMLAMEAAMASGSATPLGGLAKSLYALHGRQGQGGLDFSSILQLLRRESV